MDQRKNKLHHWLKQDLSYTIISLEPASEDASFRRYFRARTNQGVFVAMDAPPEKENCQPFIDSALALSNLDVHTPEIIAKNVDQGFILLEDLGDRVYLNELQQDSQRLYGDAISALIKIQSGSASTSSFPPKYSRTKLIDEMSLFTQWYITRHLGERINEVSLQIWEQTQQLLVSACMAQPQVWVHRDYHSRNLMITDRDSPGVIDFQDMVVGPIGYDLASIFKDCYIEWPRSKQIQWLEEYRTKAISELNIATFSLEDLTKWVDFAGLQRHLKVLGIFCRLNYRDSKSHYLDDIPLVAKYILEVLDIYPELEPFKVHFAKHIQAGL